MKRSFRTLYSATFHDSQSGLLLSKPDLGVLRIHEIFGQSKVKSSIHPVTREISIPEALSLSSNNSSRLYSATVSTSEELDNILRVSSSSSSNAQSRFSISLSTRGANTVSLRDTIALVKRATDQGFLVRACVLNAWEHGLDALEDAVARLADSGAAVITAAAASSTSTTTDIDRRNKQNDKKSIINDLDEDEVREAVERVFNLDVAGDAMLSRFCARLSFQSSKIALQAGITRLESQSDDNNDGYIIKTSELIQLAKEEGRKVIL